MFNLSLPTLNFGLKTLLVLAIVVIVANVAGLSGYKKYIGLS